MRNILLYIVCILGLILCNYVSAATIVDYKEIKDYVTNNRSGYDSLVTRFANCDTTLTNEEIARIYYGYSFTKRYSPYSSNSEINKTYKNKDYKKALKMSKKLLKSNPVSLDLLLISFVSSSNLKQETLALSARTRFNQIVSMIFDAGDGSEENPLKVICVDDEYAILRTCYDIKNFKGQALTQNMCDKMMVVLEGEENPIGIYFDVSLAMGKLSGMFK